ncbi:MAG: chromate efflux transporter [Candidatus Levyibacteriota bacterium]
MKSYSLKKLALYFLKLGTFGFGGSIALAHAMQQDLVEKKKWLTQDEFLQGLTLSQLAPGPLATQLAIYIGFVKAKTLGATLAGIAFILPSFLLVLFISMLYVHFGTLPIIQFALYGISAAIIGIIASSAYTLTKRYMKKKILLWIIYIVVCIVTISTKSTNVFLFILAGVICMQVYVKETVRIPKNWMLLPLLPATGLFTTLFSQTLVKLFLFFLLAGTIAFGGGFAILPFLQHGAVMQYHWLTNKQFLDAIAVAMITPGPVLIAATFIGYLTAGFPGALLATLAIFFPVYCIVIFLTPLFNKHAQHPKMVAFIEGVTAAAMASIVGSVVLLGQEAIKDVPTLLLACFALCAVRFLKIPSTIIILIAGIISIAIH